MREPNPDRLLARMSAHQYQEWMAFDAAFGIDGMYEKEIAAEQHELIQINNQLTGASVTKKGKKNPAGKFRRAPRPWLPSDYFADEVDDDDEDEVDIEQETQTQAIARFDAEVFPDAAPGATTVIAGDGG